MTNASGIAATPLWFRLVALIALLWEGFLGYSFIALVTGPSTAFPWFPAILFGVTVAAGLAGAIAMLAGRRWAVPLLLVSLAAGIVQHGLFFLAAPVEFLTVQILIVPALVLVLGFLFAFAARSGAKRGWLQ